MVDIVHCSQGFGFRVNQTRQTSPNSLRLILRLRLYLHLHRHRTFLVPISPHHSIELSLRKTPESFLLFRPYPPLQFSFLFSLFSPLLSFRNRQRTVAPRRILLRRRSPCFFFFSFCHLRFNLDAWLGYLIFFIRLSSPQ